MSAEFRVSGVVGSVNHWLTSKTNPLRIDELAVPGAPGLIGMTLCPGKKGPYAAFGAWDRDLQTDLQVVRDWGASAANEWIS